MNISLLLADAETSFKGFFTQIAGALGFGGLLTVILCVELFIVLMFIFKTFFSYEKRLNRALDRLNNWLFNNKKIDTSNIRDFNDVIKRSPKRVIYFWQQFILFREKDPTYYLSMDNLIEKPLKTSSWGNNIRNLLYVTGIWALITLIFGIAFEASTLEGEITFNGLAVAFAFPVFVLIIGIAAAIMLKSRKITNLDEIYHNYHIFARFIENACVDLPTFVDYDLLFTNKELEKASPQLREYYESRARQAKKEFEEAKKNDVEYVIYNFEEAGIDGSLVLERAMHETESFINKKTTTLAKIAQVEAEKEALKRNYENVQKDLQRKIQVCKENIAKYIQQQEATTNRMEVGFIRKQQEQEITKQEGLQSEYDQEETRYTISNEELDNEIKSLRKSIEDAKEEVQKAMVAEYHTFYEKIMKRAYEQSDKQVAKEKGQLEKQRDDAEKELAVVQTEIKRLVDENNTLRAKLGEAVEKQPEGVYDEAGNYVYKDGSYHDPNGLFHDVDGRVYDANGRLVSEPEPEETVTVVTETRVVEEPAQEVEEPVENTVTVTEEQHKADGTTVTKTTKTTTRKSSTKKDKQEQQDQEIKPRAKRGRPRKRVLPEEPKTPRKRGRPRKEKPEQETTLQVDVKPILKKGASTSKAKRMRLHSPEQKRKLESLARISELINEEERKLDKMKLLVNTEIDKAINPENSDELNKERDKILSEVEELKKQAKDVRREQATEELSSINERIESLIKEISDLNNK